jgi:proline iminopeptidase
MAKSRLRLWKLLIEVPLVAVTFFGIMGAEAGTQINFLDPAYQSGYLQYDKFRSNTPGDFLGLPLNPDHPEMGYFDLFYRFSKNSSPEKPTVLFLMGGPGLASDWLDFEQNFNDVNFLYVDQRGTGFSHLRSAKDMMSWRNFSSQLTARDLEALRVHLKIDQFIIFAHSYGTIPATIYAHQFPDHVKRLILEGTIASGGIDLRRSDYLLRLIQKFYDALDDKKKNFIRQVYASKALPSNWFSSIVRCAMNLSDFQQVMDNVLQKAVKVSFEKGVYFLKPYVERLSRLNTIDTIPVSGFVFTILACKELELGNPESSFDLEFDNEKFRYVPNHEWSDQCAQIPGWSKEMVETYHVEKFSLHVPVTYIEGVNDGSVPPPQTIQHFKFGAQSSAQLYFVENGGHSSFIGSLSANEIDRAINAADLHVLASAFFFGQLITDKQLRAIHDSRGLHWTRVATDREKRISGIFERIRSSKAD